MKAEVIREIAEKEAEAHFMRGTVRCNRLRLQTEHNVTQALRILEQAGFVVLPKEELEAALKPVAKLVEHYPSDTPDDWLADVVLHHRDLRRAAALLAAITQEKTDEP